MSTLSWEDHFGLACALHWFNPAAHFALRAWAHFREEAADETAITWLGQSSKLAYGETLLHVLRATNEPSPTPFMALAIVESVGQLSKRITMIKHYEHKAPRYLIAGTVFIAAAAGILLRPVQAQDAPQVNPASTPPVLAATGEKAGSPVGTSNSFTLRGTWMWKVGAMMGEKSKDPDFWWEQESDTERYLVPRNGAVAAVVNTPYDKVDARMVKGATLVPERIPGQQLRPGRVVIFRTAAGDFGKFEVTGFLPLERVGKPTIPEYDLRLRWVLYTVYAND